MQIETVSEWYPKGQENTYLIGAKAVTPDGTLCEWYDIIDRRDGIPPKAQVHAMLDVGHKAVERMLREHGHLNPERFPQ